MDGSLLRYNKGQWVSEYFCVRDGYLVRFHNNKSTKPRAKYNLKKCVLVAKVSETQFDLQPRNKATISLRADSRKLRKRWEKELSPLCQQNDLSQVDLSAKDAPAIVVDSLGMILDVNEHMCKLSGHKKEKLIKQNVAMLTPKSVAKRHDALIKRYVEGGNKKLVGKPRRLRMRTASGEEIPVVLFLSEMVCNGVMYFMAVVDRDDSASMELSLDALASAAVSADEHGTIIAANEEMAKLFGYDVSELVDSNVSILMPPSMRRAHDVYLDRYRRGKGGKFIGKPRRVMAQLKDGSRIYALVSVGELFQNGQRLVLGTFSEVEEIASGDEQSQSEDELSNTDDSSSTMTEESSTGSSRSSAIRWNSLSNVAADRPARSASPSSGGGAYAAGSNPYRTQENPRTVLASLGPEYAAAFQQVQSASAAALLAELRRLAAAAEKAASEAKSRQSDNAPSAPALDVSSLIIERPLARGTGSGCSVYSVLIEGWRCAMKELDISSTNHRSVETFLKEVMLCEALPYHPNISRYLFHTRAGDRIRLFMTQYDGTLAHHLEMLRDSCRQLPLRDIVRFARDILQGLKFLHSNRVMHRDLKSDNVFVIFNSQNEVHSLAIGDLDSARMTQTHAATMVGTPGFMAPEIMREERYTFSADVWSFGMLLYELAAMERPYTGMSVLQMGKAMMEGPPPFPRERPELDPIGEMYDRCTKMEPNERATVEQLQGMLATLPIQ